MNKLRLSKVVMFSAITVIVTFQCYWVNRVFLEEKERVQKQTDILFKELVYTMQINRFKSDTLIYNTGKGNNLFALEAANAFLKERDSIKAKSPNDSGLLKKLLKITTDSLVKSYTFTHAGTSDTKRIRMVFDSLSPRSNSILRINIHRSTTASTVVASDSIAKTKPQFVINGETLPTVFLFKRSGDTVPIIAPQKTRKIPTKFALNRSFVSLFTRSNPVADSLPIKSLDSAYSISLKKAGIHLSYKIKTGLYDSLHLKDTVDASIFRTNIATVGFIKSKWYQVAFDHPNTMLIQKIMPQAFFSLLLVAFISVAFIFLYRNLLAQQKLAVFKNEFISNITHELKTPIATVNVAIEALKNFNALQNPERTKEYLDISASEMQRLGLLVDKVLKLSMFESDRIFLNKEWFDVKQLMAEIIGTMHLQFDKKNTQIIFETNLTELFIQADKLHISSVFYNLLDNSLKYSKENATVKILIETPLNNMMELHIIDNGIGIPQQFQKKIFEKFFRVPTKDIHNVKGYGLGLSYVNHIVKQHQGYIEVKSELGKGSDFTVWLPISDDSNHTK